MRGIMAAVLAFGVLAGCNGSDRGLRDLRSPTGSPDEFSVLPTRMLEMPQDMSSLPAPTPGGSNLADSDPTGDAIAALGGRHSASQAGGIPARDAALVTNASRYGTDPAIRATLATEDAAFRKRRGRFSLFGGGADRYFRAYAAMALDAYAEMARFRALGIRVPSAPPSR